MKRIVAKEEYCMACRICEIHCLVQHSKSKKILKAFREERDKIISRMLVEESGCRSFALQCRHCDEAPCIEACMTGAMHRCEKTGAVLCGTDRCVGCWMCIMSCPVGAIQQGIHDHVASKCDLCAGNEMPACVINCPNEALTLEDDNEK
ncbi:MAG: 4Fe-4S dicluster domain-containing protein [bacterium]